VPPPPTTTTRHDGRKLPPQTVATKVGLIAEPAQVGEIWSRKKKTISRPRPAPTAAAASAATTTERFRETRRHQLQR
jgi:hypothetical protein